METMRVDRAGGLLTLTLARPEKKNALNRASWTEFDAALADAASDPEVRALVITGAGGNFSSGADLSGSGADTRDAKRPARPIIDEMRVMGAIIGRLHHLPKPTVAKVDGVAVGVGLGIALACDLVVATERARFSAIFARRGIALDGGTSWVLPRLIGLQKAKELAYFGEFVDAHEALAMGLVNRVVTTEEIDEFVDAWGQRLANGPSVALGLTKRLLNSSFAVSIDQALEDEGRSQHVSFNTDDMREALTAYAEKRDPRFSGR